MLQNIKFSYRYKVIGSSVSINAAPGVSKTDPFMDRKFNISTLMGTTFKEGIYNYIFVQHDQEQK